MADPLVSVSELRDYLQADTVPGNPETILALASDLVRSEVGHPLDLTVDEVVLLDDGHHLLTEVVLPHHPVVAVFAVDDDDDPIEVLVTTDGRMRRVHGGRLGRLTITYTHGYDPIPGAIKAVVLAAATRQIANPSALRAESIGDYQATYAEAGAGVLGGLVLTEHEKRQLDPFR